MTKAYVLMTAMPPTKGHLHLIQYAAQLADRVMVVVNTQPDEPYAFERVQALRDATYLMRNVAINHIHKELPQEPDGEPFWDMWLGFLLQFGLQPEDYIVASEMYGAKLAEISGATFMPYDIDRSIYSSKATNIRATPYQTRALFDKILPEFQPVLQQRITIFGAESTGKTTLARDLSYTENGHFIFEWARPYLESVGKELSNQKMYNIWKGQLALQKHASDLRDKALIFQDTDLYSTVGYWDYYDPHHGSPIGLWEDALANKSDLYLITQSNIPFEADPLRYGGDKREITDEDWILLAESARLNYRVLESSDPRERIIEAQGIIREHYNQAIHLKYDRIANN